MEQAKQARRQSSRRADTNAMTEDATELMQRLTVFGGKALQVLTPADVVNGMMGATVCVALGQLPPKDLSRWLRSIANEIDVAGRKPS